MPTELYKLRAEYINTFIDRWFIKVIIKSLIYVLEWINACSIVELHLLATLDPLARSPQGTLAFALSQVLSFLGWLLRFFVILLGTFLLFGLVLRFGLGNCVLVILRSWWPSSLFAGFLWFFMLLFPFFSWKSGLGAPVFFMLPLSFGVSAIFLRVVWWWIFFVRGWNWRFLIFFPTLLFFPALSQWLFFPALFEWLLLLTLVQRLFLFPALSELLFLLTLFRLPNFLGFGNTLSGLSFSLTWSKGNFFLSNLLYFFLFSNIFDFSLRFDTAQTSFGCLRLCVGFFGLPSGTFNLILSVWLNAVLPNIGSRIIVSFLERFTWGFNVFSEFVGDFSLLWLLFTLTGFTSLFGLKCLFFWPQVSNRHQFLLFLLSNNSHLFHLFDLSHNFQVLVGALIIKHIDSLWDNCWHSVWPKWTFYIYDGAYFLPFCPRTCVSWHWVL